MLSIFNYKNLKKPAVLSASILLASAGQAQGAAASDGGSVNWLLILLVIVAVVMLVVIWGLGQVILMLGKQLNDKRRKESKFGVMMALIGLLLVNGVQGQTPEAAPAVSVVSNYGGLNPIEFWALSAVIFIEVIVILFLAFMARRMYRELRGIADVEIGAALESSRLMQWWNNIDKQWMTRAVPVEKEADILLDHNYDGIRELDNALPPWWKYGFYFTLVVAVIYMMNFHVLGIGKNPEQEYAAQMEEGKKVEEAYKARTKNLVDENNVVMADALGIAEGKKLYLQSCIACHGQAGEGGIGPNLADEYWIHGGSMNDIYKTIKLGYPEKGMQSWQSMMNPVQMKEISSFVKSLKGTKPANPKAPQGDLFKE